MKINFTKEHYAKLKELAFEMLIKNGTIITKLGTPLNIVELLHTTTISTLNDIRLMLGKKIENLENKDEWVSTEVSQTQLDNLKSSKELVNLIIGYKRYNLELAEMKSKREALESQLKSLKESQKTPEDRIKELEAELNEISTAEDF